MNGYSARGSQHSQCQDSAEKLKRSWIVFELVTSSATRARTQMSSLEPSVPHRLTYPPCIFKHVSASNQTVLMRRDPP